jgi:hypothetical protein
MNPDILRRPMISVHRNAIEVSSADQLFHMMQFPGQPLVKIKGHTGILQSVQREDGSGKSFNVTLDYTTFHVRF